MKSSCTTSLNFVIQFRKNILPNFAMVVLASLMVVASASAESDGDLVCAAIHPCNTDGTVMAPFNTGECAAKYALECAGDAANKTGDELVTCEGKNSELQAEISKLQKKLARFQRAARRAAIK